MIADLISPRWLDFQKALAQMLHVFIGIISADGKLVAKYNPLPSLLESEHYPKLQRNYQAFFAQISRLSPKAGQVEIAYDPLGLPAAVARVDMDTYLIIMGGFAQEQAKAQQIFHKRLQEAGVPAVEADRLQVSIGSISREELKEKTARIASVFREMLYSSYNTREMGHKIGLLTAVDEISKLTIGLLQQERFDLKQILDLVVNSLIILCDAEGAFVCSSLLAEKKIVYRGFQGDFGEFLQARWEAIVTDAPAAMYWREDAKKKTVHGLDLNMTSFTKQKAIVSLGVVNPLSRNIQPTLEAFGRQFNIVLQIWLLYKLLQSKVGFLLNSIRHGIIITNGEGKIMVVNEAARGIFGPLGIPLTIGEPLAGQGLSPSIGAATQEAIIYGSTHVLKEDRSLVNKQQDIYLNWEVSPLYWEKGFIAGAILMLEDITQRKQSEDALRKREQEFKLLVENAPDIIARFDGNLYCTYINLAVEKQSGLPRDHFWGHQLNDMVSIPEGVRRNLQECLLSVLSDGKERLRDFEFACAEGSRYYSTLFAPEMTAEGRVASVLTITRNITKSKHMDEEILKASKLESIGMLAGGIAHDFNNFLTIMLGNISLAKLYSKEKNEIYDKLESTEAAILRAKELTQQLSIFAKGSDPVKKKADIGELLRESTEFALSGSGLSPEFDIAEDLRAVEIDIGQINQVINNIIINAVQATPEGGIIRIKAENVEIKEEENDPPVPLPVGCYVRFSIEDAGTGIPEKYLAKIFDPFFTTKAKGSGLGLSTSYKIIQKHHGHIDASSLPGVGTTFTVYLPAVMGAVETGQEEERFIKGKGKILVMDDEESIREAAGEMLSYLGYEVHFAADGLEACNLYREALAAGCPFSMVILDLTVPGGMGGRTAMAELAALDPAVKGIVASGYSNDHVMANYRDYGFTGMLRKPYRMEELSRVIYNCLEGED